jgi:transposase
MERYTARQVQRAQAQEQLLRRLDQGEDFDTLCQELGLQHSRHYLSELRRRYRTGGSTWEALIDHRHGHVSKMTAERRAWVKRLKQEQPALTQQEIARRFTAEFGVTISQGRISNILRAEGVALPGGQRYRATEKASQPMERAGAFFPSRGGGADGPAPGGAAGDPDPAGDLQRP